MKSSRTERNSAGPVSGPPPPASTVQAHEEKDASHGRRVCLGRLGAGGCNSVPGGWVQKRPSVRATRYSRADQRRFQLLAGGGWGIAAALVLFLTGCGYEFGTSAKPGAAYGLILAVPVFNNDTFEPILDKRVTEMVRREFLQADGLTLVNDVGAAPLVLHGRVNGYGLQTLSFRQGQVNEYRVSIVATVRLEDTGARKTLWTETYTASAEFFQTADLATNRSRQDRATEEAARTMAENIVSRVLEDYGTR